MSQKRYPKRTLFQRSLEIRSKVLGHFHPELSSVHNAIGNLSECQRTSPEPSRTTTLPFSSTAGYFSLALIQFIIYLYYLVK